MLKTPFRCVSLLILFTLFIYSDAICSGMKNYEKKDQYTNRNLRDTEYMGVWYAGGGSELRAHWGLYWSSYSVFKIDANLDVLNFRLYNVESNETYLYCPDLRQQYTPCCRLVRDTSYYGGWTTCNYVFYSYSWDGRYTNVAIQAYSKNPFPRHLFVYRMTVRRYGRQADFVYTDQDHFIKRLCLEIARSGHSSKPPGLDKLISTPEVHGITYKDFQSSVLFAREFESVNLTIRTWEHGWPTLSIYIYNQAASGNFSVPNEIKRVERLEADNKDYSTFTEQIQLNRRYEVHIYNTEMDINIDRGTRAIVILLKWSSSNVDWMHKHVQEWINKSPSKSNLQFADEPVRIVRVISTRDAIYRSGATIRFPYDSTQNTTNSNLKCYVRRGNGYFTETSRLRTFDQTRQLAIVDAQVYDSGEYQCLQDGIQQVSNIYIIVLPRAQDVAVYFTDEGLKAKDVKKTTLKRKDEKGRPFVRFEEPVIINCVYYVSQGLDNFDGIQFKEDVLNLRINNTWKIVSEHKVPEANDMFTWIRSYSLGTLYVLGHALEHEANCSHHYKPIRTIVQYDTLPPASDTDFCDKQVFVASLFKPPIIFDWGIETSQPQVTKLLRNNETEFADISSFSSLVGDQPALEGPITGSFYAMHYRDGGWTVVWIILKRVGELIVQNCSYSEDILIPENNKKLFENPGVEPHYGPFVLTNTSFKCLLSTNAIGLMLGSFNTEGTEWTRGEVEQTYAASIKEVITERMGKDKPTSLKSVVPDKHSVSKHRLIRLRMGWHATVNRGSKAIMIWDAVLLSNHEIRCQYRVNAKQNWRKLPSGFKLYKIEDSTMYALEKQETELTDSGQYLCTSSDGLKPAGSVRTLAVIPISEDIAIKLEYEKLITSPDDSALVLSSQEVKVHCSVEFGHGFSAKTNRQFRYETHVAPNESYVVLPFELIKSEDVRRETTYGFKQTYSVVAPQPIHYWDHTRIFYEIHLRERLRDALDMLAANKTLKVFSTFNITVKERLLPQPLPQFTIVDDKRLEERLRSDESLDIRTSLLDPRATAAKLKENVFKMQFTLFAGIPKGYAKMWLIYKSESEVVTEECVPSIVEDVHDYTDAIKKLGIYEQSKGRNFLQQQFRCIFVTEHVGLVLALFNGYDHTLPVADEEKIFKRQILKHFTTVQSSNKDSELEKKLRTEPRHQAVKLKVGWKAILRIGEKLRMIVRFSKQPGDAVKCTKWVGEGDSSKTEQVTLLKELDNKVNGYELVKNAVEYTDSGVYQCIDGSCEDCGFRSGLAPRSVYVLPDNSMLSLQLNHQTMTKDGPYEADFNQCIKGKHPYLYTEQMVSVRCTYVPSEFVQMKPKVTLLYQMFDLDERKFVDLNSTLEAEVEAYIMNKPQKILAFTIYAPTPEEFKGDLKLTCQYEYDQIKPAGYDDSKIRLPVKFTKQRDVVYRLLMSPTIFDEYVITDKPKLFDNRLHRGFRKPLDAVTFHQSGSTARLIEQNVNVYSTQQRGVPPGHSFAVTFYDEGSLSVEECFLRGSVTLTAATTPVTLKQHYSYRVSKGANYVNNTFVCTLQPEHVAMVLIAYTTYEKDEKKVKEKMIAEITEHVKFWLTNSKSTEKKQLEYSVSTRADWRVQKIRIGWFGSVNMGQEWNLLVSHQWLTLEGTKLQKARFICFYQLDVTSDPTERLNMYTQSLTYFKPKQPARMSDSGLYHCIYKRCVGQCEEHSLATPRRLLVLPDSSILQLHYNDKLFERNEPVKTQWKLYTSEKTPILCENEKMFVYCRYERVPGMSHYEHMKFSAYTTARTNDKSTTSLSYKQLPTHEDQSNVYTAVYEIEGPKLNEYYEPVTVKCELTYNDSIFDEKDLRASKKIPPISKALHVVFAERVLPVIYKEEVRASHEELEHSLRHAKTDTDSKDDYRASTMKTRLTEGIYFVTIVASLGVPKGELLLQLVFKNGDTMESDFCKIVKSTPLTHERLPLSIKRQSNRQHWTKGNLVSVSFGCVMRAEHMAIGIVAYNMYHTRSNVTGARRSVVEELAQKVKQFEMEDLTRTTSNLLKSTADRGITYSVVKLNVGWNATVKIGSPISMIGNAGDSYDNDIVCTYKAEEGSSTSDITSKKFRIKATSSDSHVGNGNDMDPNNVPSFDVIKDQASYTDSGWYVCKVNRACDGCLSLVGFIPRRLIVTPDASIARIIVTERELTNQDEWVDQYPPHNQQNQPVVLSEGKLIINCLQSIPPGSPKSSAVEFTLTSIDTNYQALHYEELGTSENKGTKLVAYRFTAPKVMEFTGLVQAKCRWKYTFDELYPPDVVGKIQPISIEVIRVIEVRAFLYPKLYAEYSTSTEPILQTQLTKLKDPITTRIEFHATQNAERLLENVYQITLLASLGIPQGSVTAWTMLQHSNHQVIDEPCHLSNLLQLAESELPGDLKIAENSNANLNRSFVNATFDCLFRPEHRALGIMTYNSYNPSVNMAGVRDVLVAMLKSVLRTCLLEPSSEQPLNFSIPIGYFASYRLAKLDIGWLGMHNITSSVTMLGYAGISGRDPIRCYYQHNNTHRPPFKLQRLTSFERIKNSYAFRMNKNDLTFADSGLYSCNLSAVCTKCRPTVGFMPRRLTVLPDDSVLEVYINRELFDSPKSVKNNYKRCTLDNTPCLLVRESTIVHCIYSQPRGFPIRPKFTFTVKIVNTGGNSSTKLSAVYIRTRNMPQTHSQLVAHSYRVTAPAIADLNDIIECSCNLIYENVTSTPEDYHSHLETLQFHKRLEIRIDVRLKPIIFKEHILSDRGQMQHALRDQSVSSISNAREFHSSGPAERLLEGIFSVTYFIRLGVPKGISKSYLLYTRNKLVQPDACVITASDALDEKTVPPAIGESKFFKEAGGVNFYRTRFRCAVKPKHMAFLFFTLTSFDYRTSIASTENSFLKLLYSSVEKWLNNANDIAETLVWSTSSSSVEFQLVKIRVGWRGSIVQGEPIVLFGTLDENHEGKPICYYRRSAVDNEIELHGETLGFMLIVKSETSSFELIKPSSELTDAGFYMCRLVDCEACEDQRQVHMRRLTVFAPKIVMNLYTSYTLFKETDTCRNNYTLDAVESYSVYSGQCIVIHCAYDVASGATSTPQIVFNYLEERPNLGSLIPIPSDLNTSRQMAGELGLHQCESYRVTTPTDVKDTSKLIASCMFTQKDSASSDDMNMLIYFTNYSLSQNFKIQIPRIPRINPTSIETSQSIITQILRQNSSTVVDRTIFCNHTNTQRISEGGFNVDYSVDLGDPVGTSEVWAIYKHSSEFIADPCQKNTDVENTISLNTEGHSVNSSDYVRVRFECYLQPQHVALFLYAFHTLDHETKLMPLSTAILPSVVKMIGLWLSTDDRTHSVPNEPLRAPPKLIGVYHLVQIRVGWRAVVNIGASILMFGRLGPNEKSQIRCFRQFTTSASPTVVRWKIEQPAYEETFSVIRSNVQFSDSGLYTCRILNCDAIPKCAGIPTRQLVVLPDSSIIQLHVYMDLDSKWSAQQCQSSTQISANPEESIRISCTYPIPRGLPVPLKHALVYSLVHPKFDSDTKTTVVTDMVEERIGTAPNEVMNVSGIANMPPVTKGFQSWQISCQLSYDVFHIPENLIDPIPANSIKISKNISIFAPRYPKILSKSIQSDREELSKKLASSDAAFPVKDAFLRTSTERRIEEGIVSVAFEVDRGVPRGWVIVWLVIRDKTRFHVDPCTQVQLRSISAAKKQQQQFEEDIAKVFATCVLQPEHVAFFIAVANIPGTNLNQTDVETQLQQALRNNLTNWLLDKSQAESNSAKCFQFDHRMIKLDVGWRASVDVGANVIMQGRLRGHSIDEIKCYYGKTRDVEPGLLTRQITIRSNTTLDHFELELPEVDHSDTGFYHCSSTSESTQGIRSVIARRRLIVLPVQTAVKCKLTLDVEGEENLRDKQNFNDKMGYLMSSQVAFAHCEHDETLEEVYGPERGFHYLMNNDQTEKASELHWEAATDTENAKPSSKQVYRIMGVTAEEYTGLLQISCVSLFDKLKDPLDIVERNDSIYFACHEIFTIQEPANGVLNILTITTDYESQPVPLGTEFICTGGIGRPALEYRWEPMLNATNGDAANTSDYIRLLVGHDFEWAGPKQVFKDAPAKGLEVDGATLRVPEDPEYRGMVYAYTCKGSNRINNKMYEIQTTIAFSVMICATRRVNLDLSIFLSRQLLSACALTGSPDNELQFYAFYFLPFVRQLILGLPYGPKSTQFNIITDDIFGDENKNNSNVIKSVRFEESISRLELAKRLHSKTLKPSTPLTGCESPNIKLTRVIEAVTQMRPPKSKRKHLVLLSFDKFLKMQPLEEVERNANALRAGGSGIILAVTHSSVGELNEFNNDLYSLLKPIKFVNILPTFKDVSSCESCRPHWEEPTLRIERAQVFNAICDVFGSRLPARTLEPKLRFSIPQNHWFSGTKLGVTCVANMSQQEEGQVAAEVIICLTDQHLLDKLTKLPINVQRLLNACKHRLASQTQTLEQSVDTVVATSSVRLDLTNPDNLLLCIQRQGDPKPQLFDGVNYTWANVTPISPKINSVRLLMTTWPNETTKAARMQCQISGYAPGSESLILFKPGSPDTSTASNFYHVLGRDIVRLSVLGFSESTNIHWLEIDPHVDKGQLLCLVWPLKETNQRLRKIRALPTQSDSVKISSPVSNLLVIPSCPTAPRIHLKPDLEASLYKKDTRLEVTCEGEATSNALPFKLYYLAPKFSIILCSHSSNDLTEDNNDELEKEIPCHITSDEDTKCDQLIEDSKQNRIYYPKRCTLTYQRGINNWFRRIELTVTKLRSDDFGSRIFCELIDLYTAQAVENKRAIDLRSDVKTVIFSMPTQIMNFVYDRDTQTWTCEAAAFPFPEVGLIEVIRSNSVWLQKQLSYYNSVVNITQPTLLHEKLLPPKDLLQLNYTVTMRFVPMFYIPGGLRSGTVVLRCSLGDVRRDLVTVIPNRTDPEEPITKVPSVPESGTPMHFTCRFRYRNLDLSHVTLQRMMDNSWLTYDLTVSTARMASQTPEGWVKIADRALRVRPMGPWSLGPPSQTVLLTAVDSNRPAVSFTIAHSTEFDVGTYYCTARTTNGTLVYGEKIVERVVGSHKQIVMAYRRLNSPHVWSSASGFVQLGEDLHFRCILWTTNMSNTMVSEFSVNPIKDSSTRNRTIYTSPLKHSMILGMIDEYCTPHAIGELTPRSCLYRDSTGRTRKDIRQVQAKCDLPTLTWQPKNKDCYLFSDNLTCHVQSGCTEARLDWNWVAGPIPQLTLDRDRFPVDRINLGGATLVLANLPRGGNYVFRCKAVCRCDRLIITNAIQATICVASRSVDDESDDFEAEISSDRDQLSVLDDGKLDEIEKDTLGPEDSDSYVSLDRLMTEHGKKRKRPSDKEEDQLFGKKSMDDEEPELWLLHEGERREDIDPLSDKKIADEIRRRRATMEDIYNAVSDSEQTDRKLFTKGKLRGKIIRKPRRDGDLSDWDSTLTDSDTSFISQGETLPGGGDRERDPHGPDVKLHQSEKDPNSSPPVRRRSDSSLELVSPGTLFDTTTPQDRTPGGRTPGITRRSDDRKFPGRTTYDRMPLSRFNLPIDSHDTEFDVSTLEDAQFTSLQDSKVSERRIKKEQDLSTKHHVPSLAYVPTITGIDFPGHEEGNLKLRRFHIPQSLLDKYDSHGSGDRVRVRTHGAERHFFVDEKSKESLLWQQLGFQSQADYLKYGDKISRLKDQNVLLPIESDTTDVISTTWKYDSSTKAYYWRDMQRLSMAPPLHRKVSNVQINRLDIVTEGRHQQRYSLPYGEKFRLHPSETIPFEIRLRTMDKNWPADDLENMNLLRPYTWTNYFSYMREKLNVLKKTKLSGAFSSLKPARIHSVILEQNPVKLPGIVTARCPALTTPVPGDYIPTAVTWIRASSLDEFESHGHEEIIHYTTNLRNIMPISTRNRLNERIYIYPPQKWSDSHTLDVVGLQLEDYGFYACVTTFSSTTTKQLNVNVTKRSEYPLCIIPATEHPTLTISQPLMMENVTVNDTDSCQSLDSTLLLECQATAYRLFCERADHVTHGVRLFDTVLSAYVFLMGTNGEQETIEINTPQSKLTPLQLPGSTSGAYKVTKWWSLKLTRSHNRAYVMCRAKPTLIEPASGSVGYMSWLRNQLDQERLSRLGLKSPAIRLCVSSEPEDIQIDPIPTRSSDGKRFGTLEIAPNRIVTCTIYGLPETEPVISIYPILPGKSDLAQSVGLEASESWLNHAEHPVKWRSHTRNSKTRVFIPSDGFSSKDYLLTCASKLGQLNTTILLRIAQKDAIFHAHINIWINVTVILILLFVFLQAAFLQRLLGRNVFWSDTTNVAQTEET